MPLLTFSPDDYDAVRAAIDTSLDADVLPNGVIGLPIYAGAAIAEVEARAAAQGLVEPDDGQIHQLTLAAIYTTALRLLPAIPALTGERLGDESYTRQPLDRKEVEAELQERLGEAYGPLTPPGAAPPEPASLRGGGPLFFRAARGRRGR